MSSFFLIELSKGLVRSASVPLLSFRMPHIGFGDSHQYLMPLDLSYYYSVRKAVREASRRELARPFLANVLTFFTKRGCVCQMFRETDHTKAQPARSVASSATRNRPPWSLKTASPWLFWTRGLFSPAIACSCQRSITRYWPTCLPPSSGRCSRMCNRDSRARRSSSRWRAADFTRL